jgi:hypothetical protein
MSQLQHVALSAFGSRAVERARWYAGAIEQAGVPVAWTVQPDTAEQLLHSPITRFPELNGPDAFSRRRGIISEASALIVVTSVKESADLSDGPSSTRPIFSRTVGTPHPESQLDIGIALGARVPGVREVPVFMPDGFPMLDERRLVGTVWESPDRLRDMGVLTVPHDMVRAGGFEGHVDFMLEVAAHAAAAVTMQGQPQEATG